ncbi:MAG: glycerol-3-phosphate 1-O-acyltransferase PlsY [Chromatiales bacterium]|nr:glycerol-3-phosphate 1-O-acyltransferase PlsY [Chromatiales bacterium]
MITAIALIVVGYLFGSVSSAIIVCRLMGLPDPRSEGSRNPGATNVLRFGGKKAAAITLAGDFLKGWLPVLLAQWLLPEPWVIAAVGLAAFLGHLYPVFFGFQGGKGVATSLGVYLGVNWMLGLAVIGTWLFMAFTFRISSLSALVSFLLAPVYVWLITQSPELLIAAIIISVLLFWRHRSNIRNLIAGTEDNIGTDAE